MFAKEHYPYIGFSFTASKFLITTGWNGNYVTKSEIIDLSKLGNYQCPDWVDYPIEVQGATGGLLGTIPIICGGYPATDECYKITAKEVVLVVKMTTKRAGAASVTINSTSLWITGGLNGNNVLSSSEFVQMEGTMPGPELPIAVYYHAMINTRNDLTMVIGGKTTGNYYSAKTFYYNHNYGNWSDGPKLNQGRENHAVGIVTDEATHEKLVIVTGGYNGFNLKSTEILISDAWSLGEKNSFGNRELCKDRVYTS